MSAWLAQMVVWLQDFAGGWIAHLFQTVRGYASWWLGNLDGSERDARGWVDWYLSWAPWPLEGIADWLRSFTKDSLIGPIYGAARWPFRMIQELVDDQWHKETGRYYQEEAARSWIGQLGGVLVILAEYGEQQISNLQTYLEELIAGFWEGLETRAGELWGDVNALWDYATVTLAGDLQGLQFRIGEQQAAIGEALYRINTITTDPGGWVWESLRPTLEARVRDWLLDRW